MPVENANLIHQLVPANPTGQDPRSEGDNHLRLLKAVLQATFPNIEDVIQASAAEINLLVGKTSLAEGTGDLNLTFANVGGGVGAVFARRTGDEIELRTIVGEGGITVSLDGDLIKIAGATTNVTVQDDGATVADPVAAVNFKGANVSVSGNDVTVEFPQTIKAAFKIDTASNPPQVIRSSHSVSVVKTGTGRYSVIFPTGVLSSNYYAVVGYSKFFGGNDVPLIPVEIDVASNSVLVETHIAGFGYSNARTIISVVLL